jgi:protocatechuate 3,4-dioxygenase beta subunit
VRLISVLGGAVALLMATGSVDRALSVRDQTPVAAGSTSLTGRVTVAGPGQPTPVRRARVTAQAENSGAIFTTDTDTTGEFRFGELPPGAYRVRAEKAGFVPAEPPGRAFARPAAIDVKSGRPSRLDIAMQRASAVEGRLLNDNGEPLANIFVTAARLTFTQYGRRPTQVRQVRTDDLGRFRLHTLPPGEYIVQAAPDPLAPVGPPPAPGERPQGLAMTYYPGTPRLEEAQRVTLGPGQELSDCDFRLTTVPTVAVLGRIVDSAGKKPSSFSFRLQRVGSPPGELRGFSIPPDNFFQFRAVPPGDYWLMGSSSAPAGGDTEFALVRLNVTGDPLREQVLTTSRGAALAGRIEIDGGGPRAMPTGLQVVAHQTEFELPVATGSSAATPVPVGADGTFSMSSVFGPRLIRLIRSPADWAVKSVWLDDLEITDTATDFRATDKPRTLRIVVVAGTPAISGTVTNARNQPAGYARVVAFTDNSRRWGIHSRWIKGVEAGADGLYSVAGLLPGRYFVVAVSYLDDGAWEDPDVLGRLQALASPVVVGGQAASPIALKVREWR